MISGGEFPIKTRQFAPFQATVALDLDNSKRGPLPNAASQPIPEGKAAANDIGYIKLENISSFNPENGIVRAFRVQTSSEVAGLFGKEGGGWSPYSVVIEETGLAYAQIVVDGAKGIYGEVFNLNNPEFGGAARRALDIAVEIVAGHEMAQLYQSGKRPAHQLVRWMLEHPGNARYQLPADFLRQIRLGREGVFAKYGEKTPIDIDHDDKKFPPGVNLVLAHEDTEFAKFDGVYGTMVTNGIQTVPCLHFQSEVDKPEYGQAVPAGHKSSEEDPLATRYTCFTTGGVKLFDANSHKPVEPSTGWDRFLLNAATGLIALDAGEAELPLTQMLKAALPNLNTNLGKTLPKRDQIEYDPWDDIGSAAWGGP